ncbi:MAG: YihY family inner membrane protein [Gammaproteobacteria bacterium]|nr:YihY family inner membrane protein [Gammaproteobacteria bacterium]
MLQPILQELQSDIRRLPKFISTIRPLDDDLTYYAASLSFYTLFAIIPMFWILFSVFSKMPVFADYYEQMKSVMMGFVVPGQSHQIIVYLDGFLENSSHMGWVGLIYIVFTSVLFFANYSDIINRIFSVPNRKLSHSMVGFIAVMVLAPFVLGASLFVSSQLAVYLNVITHLSWFNALLSYVLLSLLFYSIYKFSPNTQVDTVPAMFSAIVIAAVWTLAKNGFVYYVVVNQTYTTIYGSFSLLLFTMLWIYLSWVLCLYGFKLCYYLQYCKSHRLTRESSPQY